MLRASLSLSWSCPCRRPTGLVCSGPVSGGPRGRETGGEVGTSVSSAASDADPVH